MKRGRKGYLRAGRPRVRRRHLETFACPRCSFRLRLRADVGEHAICDHCLLFEGKRVALERRRGS
jgi:uncharacterized C2H2 Zn-finger protein